MHLEVRWNNLDLGFSLLFMGPPILLRGENYGEDYMNCLILVTMLGV